MKKAFQMSKKALIKIGILVVVVVLIVTAVLVNVIRKNRLSEESLVIIPPSRKLSKAEIVTLSKQWDTDKVDIVEDKNGIPVPVPYGYTESSIDGEDCVDTGFVIYKNIQSCTGEVTESNEEECQTTRDQYVWVPVYDPKTMYGIDTNGVMHGKTYEFTASGRSAYRWTEDVGVMKLSSSTSEPYKQALSNSEVPDYLSEESEKYNKEFYGLVKSVEKYGGFYIGRYELGDVKTGSVRVVKNNSNVSNMSWDDGVKKSRYLDQNAIGDDGKAVDVVTTFLTYSCTYDATLEWLVESNCKTYSDVGDDSKSWGVYEKEEPIPSGSEENSKANNIYDLAGNVSEFTQEKVNGSAEYACRGGSWKTYNPPDTRKFITWGFGNSETGGRAALYIDVDKAP